MASKGKRIGVIVAIVVAVVILAAGAFAWALFSPKGTVVEECTERYFTSADMEAGFHELLDLQNQQTWGTQDISEEDWEALDLPITWSLWIKNTPRELMSRGFFTRSPGCPEDGQFLWKNMYGVDWLNVADFKEMNTPVDEDGLMTRTIMNKFHELTYDPGAPVWYITSPEGKRYLIVTRDYDRTTDTPTLPAGWSISEEMTLTKPLILPLMGDKTENYRVSNGDSFQGPLPDSLIVEDYTK